MRPRPGCPRPAGLTSLRAAGALAVGILLALGGAACERTAPGGGAPAVAAPAASDAYLVQREEMVRAIAEVVKDSRVLDAMRRVPRHEFVSPALRSRSYVNTPLSIPENQTISQPEIVGIMTEALALQGDEKVLEIGTGSGYQAAVLGELAREVYSVEIRPALAESARKTLAALRERGVLRAGKIEVITGDGFQGYAAAAPYDCIIVTAAPRQVPTELINQLKPGGRMVIPVGDFHQELQLIKKALDGTHFTQNILPVRFVPMVRPEEAR